MPFYAELKRLVNKKNAFFIKKSHFFAFFSKKDPDFTVFLTKILMIFPKNTIKTLHTIRFLYIKVQ